MSLARLNASSVCGRKMTAAMLQQILLSLGVLSLGIVAVVAVLKLLGRMPVKSGVARLQCIAVLPLGPRQKILMIEADGEKILLGVTASSITPILLSSKAAPTAEQAEESFEQPENFSALLQQWLNTSAKKEAC
jgi:flagellar protein FliO/FliZ